MYLGKTPSGVLLEYTVHLLEHRFLPVDPFWIEALYPSSVQVEVISESTLPRDWRNEFHVTRDIGDNWLRENRTAFLDVPSVIILDTRNCLLNPAHPDAVRISVHEEEFYMDKRLAQIVQYAFSYREEVPFVNKDS